MRLRSSSTTGSKRRSNNSASRRARIGQRTSIDSIADWLYGEPDLAEVLGVGPEHVDLSGSEPGGEHEPVESVVLDLAAEEGDEGPAELRTSLPVER